MCIERKGRSWKAESERRFGASVEMIVGTSGEERNKEEKEKEDPIVVNPV